MLKKTERQVILMALEVAKESLLLFNSGTLKNPVPEVVEEAIAILEKENEREKNGIEIVDYVYETKNYDFFSDLVENRNQPVRKNLLKELSEKGQFSPVLCHADGSIEDGSTRKKALVQLSKPVRFILTDAPKLSVMRSINASQRTWTVRDHVESFAKEGQKEYIKVLRAHKLSGISMNYICEIAGGRNNDVVRNGDFSSDRWDEVFDFLKYHKRFKPVVKTWGSQGFVNALFHLYSVPKINKKRLLEKVTRYRDDFQNIEKKSDVIKKILRLYNQGFKNTENSIDFYFDQRERLVINEEMSHWMKEEEKKAI